jgi:hypothetical protein
MLLKVITSILSPARQSSLFSRVYSTTKKLNQGRGGPSRSGRGGSSGGNFEGGASNTRRRGPSGASGNDEIGGGGGGEKGRGSSRGFSRNPTQGDFKRQGRPYLDPKATRHLEAVRSDPNNTPWGGMVDIIEHSAYCDGQREEDDDGFFFDNTRPEYDSDCDGDPFSNGYLTEDEYELPESYKPAPYIPGRIMDQLYFLHMRSPQQWPLARLSSHFGISPERASAMINLKSTEGIHKSAGMYDERLDQQMEDLYRSRFGSRRHSEIESIGRKGDLGVKYDILQDDQTPDDAMPVRKMRSSAGGLRVGHSLSKIPPPPLEGRVHGVKLFFRDISGSKTDDSKRNPVLTSDYDGSVRYASNIETLYRSWGRRRWMVKDVNKNSKLGYPFADKDTNKGPSTFKIAP